MSAYDKELINSRITEVCDYYLPGEGRRDGPKRRTWTCPICGKDAFSANDQRGYAGCFSTCEMPRANDAIAIIAYFEGLEQSGQQFVYCLQKGYEILAIPEPEDEGGSSNGGRNRGSKGNDAPTSGSGAIEENGEVSEQTGAATQLKDRTPEPRQQPSNGALSVGASASSLALLQSLQNGSHEAEGVEEEDSSEELTADQYRELVDRVYRAFLELCPLIERDREWWHYRGVNDATIEKGGFGSIWREHCHEVLSELARRFGQQALTSVPGFYVSPQGRIHTNLYDNYTLIPYYDRDGFITTVEGRVPGTPEGDKPKYMAPVNSGLHLYVFPGYKPEQVSAFCEGAVGAIVAAQSGIPVAAIKGYQHYRIFEDGGYRPLPEHARTDFGGRKVLYIPDEDVKPKTKKAVEAEAPKAAKALIADHGGTPYIARLPEGYKDLDEWLLDLDPDERLVKFAELMEGALTPERWAGNDPQHEDKNQEENNRKRTTDEPTQTQTRKDERNQEEVYRTQERTEEDDSREDGDAGSETADEQDDRFEDEDEQTQPIGLKTPDPGPRTYRRMPITNIGEFMVALICGLAASLGFLLLVVFAAPAWEPAGFIANVPVRMKLLVSLLIAAGVMTYVCWKLYHKRRVAIRNHLAGKR